MHKRKILPILLVTSLCAIFMCGCTKVEREERADVSRFKVVETASLWRVVYDRDTKVMYTVSYGGYNCGNFTLLVDADGKPLLWNGKGDDF